jgi:hypothetical protein
MKRGSAWAPTLLTVGAALVLFTVPVAPQSPSLVAEYALTEVDVVNAPLTAQTPDHQFSAHGFINFTHDWQAPILKVCAEEAVKPDSPHTARCSQICYYQHDCKAIFNPPLQLSSPKASIHVQIQEPDMQGQAFYAAKFIVTNVGNFQNSPYVIDGKGGFRATFVVSTDYKKGIGLATSATQAAKKFIQYGKIPLPPLLSLGDVAEGAQNAYNESVQRYNMCLNGKASQYPGLVAQSQRCQAYVNADYGSCMADVLANADHQDVLVANPPQGCADKLGQPVLDTQWQVARAALCRWINYGSAFFGTQACTPATKATPGAPPYSPFQNCLMGAIESMNQLDPAGPNLTAQASQMCNSTKAKTQGAWEYCIFHTLTGPPNALLDPQVAIRNFYREAGVRAGICLNVRARQDPKWNPTH